MMLISRYPRFVILCLVVLIFFTAGCEFIRPTRALPPENQPTAFVAPTFLPTITPLMPTPDTGDPAENSMGDCTNDLAYLDDLTLPDGTQVNPGVELEKEWQVKNIGTCNWNEKYSLQLISGPDLGAVSPQALVPALNSMKAVIRIIVTSPTEPGRYTSTWRAFDPQGEPFGEWFSVEIVVVNP